MREARSATEQSVEGYGGASSPGLREHSVSEALRSRYPYEGEVTTTQLCPLGFPELTY